MQKLVATSLASLMFAGTLINPMAAEAQSGTSTPIKHLVVIFQENISFDHYFGTYPKALNPPGQPRFIAKPGHAGGEWLYGRVALQQSECLNSRQRKRGGQSLPPRSFPGRNRRSGSRLHAGTAGVSRRIDGLVPQVHGHARSSAQWPADDWAGDGLLRRQHRDRVLELCAAVCHE